MPHHHSSASGVLALPPRSGRALITGAVLLAACFGAASSHAGLPENLGPGLREMAADYQTAAAAAKASTLTHAQFGTVAANYPRARADETDRVLVNVYFDGSKPIDEVVKKIEELGCTVTARVDWYRHGAISVYLPLNLAEALASQGGVNSVLLDHQPIHRVGQATSQGTVVLKSDAVNALGYYGAGITVGAQSDSFGTARKTTTTAADDEADDDLPGPGSAYNTTPVNVLLDYEGTLRDRTTDEGRAMCQIIHDVAPAANIAFATADVSEIGFAQNIIALATPVDQTATVPANTHTIPAGTNGSLTVNGAGCQVICDDVGYYDEPMFSDGIVAQAIDTATNTYGATYFSSAGNDGSSGYAATYSAQPVNETNEALLATEGNINFGDIPAAEEAVIESFHSFGTDASGHPILVQKVMQPKTGGSAYNGQIVFQWDDPFSLVTGGVNQVTTDFDILVFSVDSSGGTTYVAGSSGTSNNFSTNVPYEIPGTSLKAGTQYEFVIVRTNRTPGTGITPNQATHIRWAVESDASQVIADFVGPNNVESYGHNCASTCIGTAAYVYDKGFNYLDSPYVPEVETYSSNGPSTIYFDSAGNRLSTPIVRKQPTLATVDGVDTSFFGSDSDGDGLPNFFGTSAAAPHGAGCAALLLNAAAINGITVAPANIRKLLISTTQGTQDEDPAQSNATGGPISFQAINRSTYSDPDAYTITYNGALGGALREMVIDLTPSGNFFYTGAYDLTAGQTTAPGGGTAPTISGSALGGANTGATVENGSTLTLDFADFKPRDTLSFGVAVGDLAGDITGGDDLAGATFTATVGGGANATTYTGTLANLTGKKWNVKSGHGLLDVKAALNRMLGK